MAYDGLSEFVAVVLGGAIALGSSFIMERWKWRHERAEAREQTKRLIGVLYEEVEQLAELLDVDLGVVEREDLGSIMEFGRGGEDRDGWIKATIRRIEKNRTVFESQAPRLLELPGYLPNQLVRFHARLQVNCGRMLDAVDSEDLNRIRDLRETSYSEAEVLKSDLKSE